MLSERRSTGTAWSSSPTAASTSARLFQLIASCGATAMTVRKACSAVRKSPTEKRAIPWRVSPTAADGAGGMMREIDGCRPPPRSTSWRATPGLALGLGMAVSVRLEFRASLRDYG